MELTRDQVKAKGDEARAAFKKSYDLNGDPGDDTQVLDRAIQFLKDMKQAMHENKSNAVDNGCTKWICPEFKSGTEDEAEGKSKEDLAGRNFLVQWANLLALAENELKQGDMMLEYSMLPQAYDYYVRCIAYSEQSLGYGVNAVAAYSAATWEYSKANVHYIECKDHDH